MKKKSKEKSVPKQAFLALKKAARDLVKERKKAKDYVIIWRNGKVVRVAASRLS